MEQSLADLIFRMYPDCPRLFPARLQAVQLVLEDIPCISQLSLFTGLQSVALVNCGIAKITGLEKLRLRELRLDENRIAEISGLERQDRLVHLHLSHNCVRKISGLEDLCGLQVFWICENQLESLSGLQTQQKLKQCWAAGNPLSTLNLPPLPHLQSLNLSSTNLSDPRLLPPLPCLTSLSLKHPLFSASPICSLPQYRLHILIKYRHLKTLDTKNVTGKELGRAGQLATAIMMYERGRRRALFQAFFRVRDRVGTVGMCWGMEAVEEEARTWGLVKYQNCSVKQLPLLQQLLGHEHIIKTAIRIDSWFTNLLLQDQKKSNQSMFFINFIDYYRRDRIVVHNTISKLDKGQFIIVGKINFGCIQSIPVQKGVAQEYASKQGLGEPAILFLDPASSRLKSYLLNQPALFLPHYKVMLTKDSHKYSRKPQFPASLFSHIQQSETLTKQNQKQEIERVGRKGEIGEIGEIGGCGEDGCLDLSWRGITSVYQLIGLRDNRSLRELKLTGNPLPLYQKQAILNLIPHLQLLDGSHPPTPPPNIFSYQCLASLDQANLPRAIQQLDISHNFLTSLASLVACQRLVTLDASDNMLASLASLPPLPLQILRCARNRMTSLDLQCHGLLELYLEGNLLDKSIAWQLVKLPGLVLLQLEGNKLVMADRLQILCYLPELKVFDGLKVEDYEVQMAFKVHGTTLTSVILEQRAKSFNLIELSLTDLRLKFTQQQIDNTRLPYLAKLNLSRNNLFSLGVLGKLPNLRYLNASHNRLLQCDTDSGGLSNCPNLIDLNLQSNCLSTLPVPLPALKLLNLQKNLLQHFDFTLTPALQEAALQDNIIVKVLEEHLGEANRVMRLGLARNKVVVVGGLGRLGLLVELDLTGNEVGEVGELRGLTGLDELRALWVAQNPFYKPSVRKKVVELLPRLVQLNGKKVIRRPESAERTKIKRGVY